MNFPILFDSDSTNSETFGIRGLPVAYLLDSAGNVVWEGIMVRGKADGTSKAKPELEAAIKEQAGKTLGGRINSILADLGSDSMEIRDRGQAELRRLVLPFPRTARLILKNHIASVSDPEVRGGLKAALDQLPPLEIVAALEQPAVLGRRPAIKVRIRNVSQSEQVVVPALDGSDASARYPRVEIRVTGPGGDRLEVALPERGIDLKSITPADFVRLAPDGEIDLFGRHDHGVLKSWVPSKPGRYKISVSVDYRERGIGHWMGTAAMKDKYLDQLEQLLSRVSSVKIESSIDVEVK